MLWQLLLLCGNAPVIRGSRGLHARLQPHMANVAPKMGEKSRQRLLCVRVVYACLGSCHCSRVREGAREATQAGTAGFSDEIKKLRKLHLPLCIPLLQCFSAEGCCALPPKTRYLAMSGDFFGCHN